MNGGEFLTEPRPAVLCTAASKLTKFVSPLKLTNGSWGVRFGSWLSVWFGHDYIYIYIYIILHQSQYFQTLFLCLTKFDCGKLEFDLDLIEINLILSLVEN